MKIRKQLNWSQYNRKTTQIARIDFFLTKAVMQNWAYKGKRKPGGKVIYSDEFIEICLIVKEFYKLCYRKVQGFLESIIESQGLDVQIPHHTTLSRRCGQLKVSLLAKASSQGQRQQSLVLAVDSTGLSVSNRSQWCELKHNKRPCKPSEKWRKLHVIIDTETGEILASTYGRSVSNDGEELPGLLSSLQVPISAVCGDMAYDKVNCREAIQLKGARQLIPPFRNARETKDNRNLTRKKAILKERDDAIRYIKHNTINGDSTLARASWRQKVGYHARSLVETTMYQIKQHCRDTLTTRKEINRAVQARIKCKLLNMIIAA